MKSIDAVNICKNETEDSSIVARLFQHAESAPHRDAVVTTNSTVSYATFAQQVIEFADHLNTAGISNQSIVGIVHTDDTEHLLATLALIHLGATSFSIPTYESRRVYKALLKQCGATHVVSGRSVEHELTGEFAELKSAREARLFFSTSGTTGRPKVVIQHDSDLVAQAHRHIGSPEERFACIASMQHNFVKRHRLYCVAAGASNVMIGAETEELVEHCLSMDVNVLHVSAFQAQELLALPGISSLSAIRLKLGGSHVPLQLRQRLRDNVTSNLQAGYGTTETGAIAFTDPDDYDAGESVGRPLAGIEVKVVNEAGVETDAGEAGELAIRCNGLFRGYLGNPELTAKRLNNGWFYTGDVGYLDNGDRIHLSGRSDDMFTFNSINVYPQDIESRICRYPGVKEALVLPKQSTVHGHIPVAFVVFDSEVDPDLNELNSFVANEVGVRCPRQFTRVDELPRNASGKLSRRELTAPSQ